ncbi:family 43 glycosylhydrolase [Burkholderia territorii]|uniref:family 43 glycosylhydrolase n=1 Tax=Burkholderia territorii TaxID=1503055 RepID=UPI0009BF1727|nr:family 43 glycosylhydrolase [Burkholderia territorii]
MKLFLSITRMLGVVAAVFLGLLSGCGGDGGEPAYTIHGTVIGLDRDESITLKNSNIDTLIVIASGSFTFSGRVPRGGSYQVTIEKEPIGKICTLADNTGSGSGVVSDVNTVKVVCAARYYTIGGTIDGLVAAQQVTLKNNGNDTLILQANGTFTFPTPVAYGGSYQVTVDGQPPGQTCSVADSLGSGVGVTANIASIRIRCSTNSYRIAGTVNGLSSGQQVTLLNNGADALTLKTNGTFAFATPVAYRGSYQITVGTQPTGQTCTVVNGRSADGGVTSEITSLQVMCSNHSYQVGGTLSGLRSGQMVLLSNNASDTLALRENGSFVFSVPVVFGGNYHIAVGGQPAYQTCMVSGGDGFGVAGNVSSIRVTCIDNTITIGGTVDGLLISQRLVLQNNGGDALGIVANGPFTFPTPIASGGSYTVSIAGQPIGDDCAATGNSGTGMSVNVQNVTIHCVAQTSVTNPVYKADFPDPSIIYVDGYYYAYATGGGILKSSDLANWSYVGNFINTSQGGWSWGTPGAGAWAPDIQKIGGKYLLYYALSTWGDPNPGIGVAVASSPSGPWVDHGKLFTSDEIKVNNSIDPSVFASSDGRVYMVFGSMRGVYIVEMTVDGLGLKDGQNAANTRVRVAGFDTSTGWNASTYEGAYVRYRNGFYYLFLSTGTCCDGVNSTYHVVVGRSNSPTGPYFDNTGLDMRDANRGFPVVSGNAAFAGPGHNSLISDTNGDWWIVYHAYQRSTPQNGRELMVDRLVWNTGGWPSVAGGTPHHLPFMAQ